MRVWDLPTRLFHWALLVCVVGSVISAEVGGSLMPWHFRLGYCVFTLVLWRVIWGLIGGRWSRFASFIFAPGTVVAYLRGQGRPADSVGHNPLGAGSVFAVLALLAAQVATGLLADDEIANVGPLNRLVSTATGLIATSWHKDITKVMLFVLVGLHVAAIAFYYFRKRENLVRPMVTGDKDLPIPLPSGVGPSRDDARSRGLAAALLLLCTGVVAWVVK